MSLKLSLSKNKAARRQTGEGPGLHSRSLEQTPSDPTPLAQPAPSSLLPAINNVPGQQPKPPPPRQEARCEGGSNMLRLLDADDDSDWESDSEASQGTGAPPVAAPTAAAPAGAAAASGDASVQPAQRLQVAPLALGTAQLPAQRLSEVYDLCESSGEDDGFKEEQRRPGGRPASSGAEKVRRAAPLTKPASGAAATAPARPALQPAHAQQPQHRKRSFDQEEGPGAAGVALDCLPALPAPAVAGGQSSPAALPFGSDPGSGQDASSGAGLEEYADVKAWLQGLHLEQHFKVFVREEIDLTIVHALTAEDLASIGITQRAHQQALLAAGQKLGAARRGLGPAARAGASSGAVPALAALGRPPLPDQPAGQRHFGGAGRVAQGGVPLQPLQQQPPRQQQQQRAAAPPGQKGRAGRGSHQSLLQVWQANSAAQAAAGAAAAAGSEPAGSTGGGESYGSVFQQPRPAAEVWSEEQAGGDALAQESLAGAGTRPRERELFAQLYPTPPEVPRLAAPPALLRPSALGSTAGTSAGAARVPPAASLWLAAAECRQVAPSMEERLTKRRAETGLNSASMEKLARGGTAYPQVEESRALRLLKLEALRQELAMHEETVAELKKVIQGLEAELGL